MGKTVNQVLRQEVLELRAEVVILAAAVAELREAVKSSGAIAELNTLIEFESKGEKALWEEDR